MAEKITLARPYAKAMFEFAEQNNEFEKWSKVITVLSLIASDAKVIALLKDRSIPFEDILIFFTEVAGSVLQLSEHSKNFIAILAKQKRLKLLPEIKSLYEEMRANAEKTATVQFVTAVSLSQDEEAMFKKMLEKYLSRTVKLQCAVDKSLLGGYVATTGNYVIDGSVRGFLTNLKQTIGDTTWA